MYGKTLHHIFNDDTKFTPGQFIQLKTTLLHCDAFVCTCGETYFWFRVVATADQEECSNIRIRDFKFYQYIKQGKRL